ncbi:MAG: HAMP domain-containing histidine kinase [Devosia sp.]|uniref:HAMP domain-containing sensor histidine kinase n=1 Tax=Devosia sp. TaxID=1871048 RepID=UPI001AC01A39|nr:HAMP domain-containing sensor histidine kinase [Devosia sp.]MBN9317922.1 HAMP domain-containing histidine kinase [Devosia sp.]
MFRLSQLWRTTTVRLTALFMLIFVVFAVGLLGLVFWQTSVQLQRQQTDAIDREAAQLMKLDSDGGFRATIVAVQRLSTLPGPGIYYLADPSGQVIVGNVTDLPPEVVAEPGTYSFNYSRTPPFDEVGAAQRQGTAVVRTERLSSGLILVVGRDVVERRGFTAIVFQWFAMGVGGILLFSLIAGVVTSVRVLRRIDTITSTSNKIMAGDLSERVPVTGRNDEFDALATNLNAMLDRIETLMQGMKEVTDNVAHDLKTPLTRLRNKAESALRENQDEGARREALETTIEESDKLIKTFNALLMIARAEAGTPSGALTDIDLSAVVGDVAELYGPLAEDEGLTLDTDIDEGVRIHGNRELLGQALVNLIENALKYHEPVEGKAGLIKVSLKSAGGRVLITVADNGPGIPEADRGRVVERFVRLEKSRTEAGSGLGLSLVAAVARLHRGELRLEDNAPGVRAVVDLPAAQGATPQN